MSPIGLLGSVGCGTLAQNAFHCSGVRRTHTPSLSMSRFVGKATRCTFMSDHVVALVTGPRGAVMTGRTAAETVAVARTSAPIARIANLLFTQAPPRVDSTCLTGDPNNHFGSVQAS